MFKYFRRKVALQYLELTQRELEYVALSRDTTEADLKQRREIHNATAKYFDQVNWNFSLVYRWEKRVNNKILLIYDY